MNIEENVTSIGFPGVRYDSVGGGHLDSVWSGPDLSWYVLSMRCVESPLRGP